MSVGRHSSMDRTKGSSAVIFRQITAGYKLSSSLRLDSSMQWNTSTWQCDGISSRTDEAITEPGRRPSLVRQLQLNICIDQVNGLLDPNSKKLDKCLLEDSSGFWDSEDVDSLPQEFLVTFELNTGSWVMIHCSHYTEQTWRRKYFMGGQGGRAEFLELIHTLAPGCDVLSRIVQKSPGSWKVKKSREEWRREERTDERLVLRPARSGA
nr:hypothetical protein CFP56_50936 [Quercus suber]